MSGPNHPVTRTNLRRMESRISLSYHPSTSIKKAAKSGPRNSAALKAMSFPVLGCFDRWLNRPRPEMARKARAAPGVGAHFCCVWAHVMARPISGAQMTERTGSFPSKLFVEYNN